ncbi:hypothetical protein L1987_48297 [Smallanthus sonchifolius]|uniref:Uncharacterized protein n=1 Tax=Smallanthus sonchifolius TaxID=185202 RepID=A0ACB9FSH1_9ASTR|nr:hypothetical protein L1987_48297 [Smallanthus sonchifolius]
MKWRNRAFDIAVEYLASCGLNSEKYPIKDNHTIADNNTDCEEEYDSKMDSINLEDEENVLVNDTTREDEDDESESDE